MRPIPVPKPSREAFKYYNTLIFHGYFRAFITAISLITGGWMLFGLGGVMNKYISVRWLHLMAGWFGIYLVLAHVVGYFLCGVMNVPRVKPAKKQLADTGWVMMGLLGAILLSGIFMWLGNIESKKAMQLIVITHVGSAICYAALSITHFYYYWTHWKPALKGPAKKNTAPKE